MPKLADPMLLTDVQRFGAADMVACYSCGNCTAICPLADNDATFPRKLIRLAQVGLADDLVASKELWTCYHCGVCSDRCPTEADPGEFMASARRYAIARHDRTGLARLLYTRPAAAAAVVAALAVALVVFLLGTRVGEMPRGELALFEWIPYAVIHWMGIGVMAAVVVFALLGLASFVRGMATREGVTWHDVAGTAQVRRAAGRALWSAVGIESLGQKRFRDDCHDDRVTEPLWRRRWLLHALSIWGFLGLLLATTLDYLFDVTGIKATGTMVPLWYPTRLLGTVAGLAMMYGVTVFAINRYQRYGQAAKHSDPADWFFLAMLWLTGFTGFVIEVALYAPPTPVWGYWFFVLHVAIAMELLLLLPFTKFAHVMYRPVALFFYALAKQRTPA